MSDSEFVDEYEQHEEVKRRGRGKEKNTTRGYITQINDHDRQSAFYIVFQNGHSIRSIIQYLKEFTSYANIFLTKNKIYFLELNKHDKNTILHFTIDTSKIIKYITYNEKERIKIGFSTIDLWAEISKVGKDNNFIMSKMQNTSQLNLSFDNDSHRAVVNIMDVNEFGCENVEIESQPDYNFHISLKELQKGAGIIKSFKGNFFLNIYKRKLTIEGENERKDVMKIQKFEEKDPCDDFSKFMGLTLEDILRDVVDKNITTSIEDNYEKELEHYSENKKFSNEFYSTDESDELLFRTNISSSLLKIFTKLSTLNYHGIINVSVYKEKKIVSFSIVINEYSNLTLFIR